MTSKPGRVVCVGHAAHDTVYRIDALPPRPTKVRASACDRSVGGMAANAACAIAALGGRVTFHGPVGDDETGDRVVAALRAAGVDTAALVRVVGARTSHSAIIVQADGERLIVSHHGDALDAEPGDDVAALDDVDVALVDVRWPSGARRACDAARQRGVPVVLDGEMGNVALLVDLVPRADHVIFSEPGYAEWARAVPAPGAVAARLAALVDAGAVLAAVTQGERGVTWASRAADGGAPRTGHLPAFPVVAVETLGAGDAFHGAYALALAEGASPDAALRFAAATAALRCTRLGGNRHLPIRAEVMALLG